MQRGRQLLFGVGILAAGVVLLVFSLVFLSTCAGGLLVGSDCTLVLHWPTIVPALALLVLAAFILAHSIRVPEPL